MNFPVERMPVCGGPEPSKLLSPRQVVPVLTKNIQSPLPTPPASTTSSTITAAWPILGSNAQASSSAPQLAKRKAWEENVTDDEEGESSETPGKMSKKARSEPAVADTSTIMSPEIPEPSTAPMGQSEERIATESNTATASAALATPFPEPSATNSAQPEERTVVQPDDPILHTASPSRNDIVDLTADDDDALVKIEPSETQATPKRDKGKGRAVLSESRAIPEEEDDMTKEDIIDEIELLDIQSRENGIQRRKIELRAKLRRKQRG